MSSMVLPYSTVSITGDQLMRVEQPVLLQEAGLTEDAAPSNGVLAAFGARDAPVALPGGSATAYAASGLVFKRGQDDNFTA